MAQIAAAPMQSQGTQIAYPRLTDFPDAKVKAAVNAALAAQEKQDRANRKDCLDQLRKRKVRKEESASFDTDAGEVDRFQFIPEQRADVDPQRQMMSTEVQERVQEVLAQLTPRERLVFEMRHFQGMRLRAIGDSLSVTEEAAKNCLFRATQKMRSALGDFV